MHSGDVVCKELAFLTPPPRPTEREQVFEPLWCVSVVRLLAPGATGLIVLPPVAQSIPGIPLGLLGLGGGRVPEQQNPEVRQALASFLIEASTNQR